MQTDNINTKLDLVTAEIGSLLIHRDGDASRLKEIMSWRYTYPIRCTDGQSYLSDGRYSSRKNHEDYSYSNVGKERDIVFAYSPAEEHTAEWAWQLTALGVCVATEPGKKIKPASIGIITHKMSCRRWALDKALWMRWYGCPSAKWHVCQYPEVVVDLKDKIGWFVVLNNGECHIVYAGGKDYCTIAGHPYDITGKRIDRTRYDTCDVCGLYAPITTSSEA